MSLSRTRIRNILGILAFSAAVPTFALGLFNIAGVLLSLGGIAILIGQISGQRSMRRAITQGVNAAIDKSLEKAMLENRREVTALIDASIAPVVAEMNVDHERVVQESKRITDKFTQKTIGAVEREFDQLSQALASELRLMREESLAAANVRAVLFARLAHIEASLNNASAGVTDNELHNA